MTEIIMKGAREEIKDGGGKREGLRQNKYILACIFFRILERQTAASWWEETGRTGEQSRAGGHGRRGAARVTA